MDKREQIIKKAESEMGRKIPRRYVPKSLSIPDLRKQIASIKKGTTRPQLKTATTRRSKWTIKAEKYFGKGNTSKDDMVKTLSKSKPRQIKLKEAFDIIYDRGMKAYQTSGSRPNQTPQSWGQARVFSVLFGGKARQNDADIVKKYRIPLLGA